MRHIYYEEYSFLGATPDGIIDSDTIVEIKCPMSAANLNPDDEIRLRKIKFWNVDRKTKQIIGLNKRNAYYFQVQGQLNITRKEKCIFAVWTGPNFPLKVVEIKRDTHFWEQMVPKLTSFFFNALLPEIVDPRYTRKLPIREPFIDLPTL